MPRASKVDAEVERDISIAHGTRFAKGGCRHARCHNREPSGLDQGGVGKLKEGSEAHSKWGRA